MAGPPRCSVVIPTYNRVELLRYTLDSLVRQTLPKDRFEVLIADDGSDDGTAEMVQTFTDRLDLRYLYQERDGFGVARARNMGISAATGEVCVMLDSGMLAHTELLAAHLDSHESAAGPLAVCGYVYCFDLDDEHARLIRRMVDLADPDATMAKLQRRGIWLDLREGFYRRYHDDLASLPAPWLVYWTSNVSARTEQLRAIGMFDEAFRSWGGEDLDIGYRLHRDGARFVLNRRAAAIHYPHEKDFGENAPKASANYEYMVQKYDTPIVRLLLRLDEFAFFDLNEVIREHGIPSCADYLAGRAAAPQPAGPAEG